MSDDIDRAELRRLHAAATPGPWEAEGGDIWTDAHGFLLNPRLDDADAEFIAAARSAVPALLDALEQAEAERDAVAVTAERMTEYARKAEARIQAVRDLHSSSDEQVIMGDCAAEECDHQEIEDCPTEPFTVCSECYRAAIELNPYYGEQGVNDVAWPCPTIRALDGAP